MSQQRTRKAVGAELVSRSRAAIKASGNVASNVQPKQRQRSRSKTKIPKLLRYDLENALVGLCDVWFGEIKPHLVRNNIKLHVHGEPTREEPASGDHRQLPFGAPGCSHIDPATAASVCELCRLLFNAANSIESAVSQAANAAVPIAGFINPCQSCKPKKRRRRCRRGAPLPQPEWRVPRLCRTYSLLTHTPRALPKQRPATEYHLQHQPRQRPATEHHIQHQPRQPPATEHHLHHQNKYSPLYQRRRPKLIDKSTQTTSLQFLELHQTRPQAPPTRHLQNSSAPPRKQQKQRQSIANQFYVSNNDLRNQDIPRQMRSSDPTVASIRCSGTRTLLPNQRSRQAKHQPSNFAPQHLAVRRELSQSTASSAACPRFPATTTLSKQQKRHPQPSTALFQDDLIDIIAEKEDKKLRMLFKSPPRDEIPSKMNLMHTVARCNPKAIKKATPWR